MQSSKNIFILKFLFTVVLFELVLGGSGHFIEIGPLTLRMVFYLILVPISILSYAKRNSTLKGVNRLIVFFSLMLILGIIVGIYNNASILMILNDVKPLLYFYMLLFFLITIRDLPDIIMTIKIVKIGSVLMGIIYCYFIYLLFYGKINYESFYGSQSEIGELVFRNEYLFFYKGFLYLPIGFFFFLISNNKYKFVLTSFLFLCICLTLTRGFILFTVLVTCYYLLFINKKISVKLRTIFTGIVLCVYCLPILFEYLGDKSISDSSRIIQIAQVLDNVTPLSFLFGHGFGIGVEIRPEHMEIAFLEIFHKQGILGLFVWTGIFSYIINLFKKIKSKYYKSLAYPFMLSVIFVILQSFTNPYLNNPIGLCIIIISVVVFSRLNQLQQHEKTLN